MRVLMTGGGSGGHINPALAIARIILDREPDAEIAFVGTPRGMENQLVTREGFKIYHVTIRGMRRGKIVDNFKTFRYMRSSIKEAKDIIKEFKPDVCIGTGGFVSWPLIRAAQSMGIPTAMHESNALAGVAVKVLAPRLGVLFLNFEETKKQVLCRNVIVSGNPMRKGFSTVSKEEARAKLGFEGKYDYSVLSCGGSLGAEAITAEIIGTMKNFSSKHPEVHHLHQAGNIKIADAQRQFNEAKLDEYPNLEIEGYIYDMPERLSAADVVINRAGAMTIAELAYLGKPSILIPSPNVTDNHQYKNAKALSDRGACILIEESELNGNKIAEVLSSLLFDEQKKKELSENISKFAVKNTDEIIYEGIKKILK